MTTVAIVAVAVGALFILWLLILAALPAVERSARSKAVGWNRPSAEAKVEGKRAKRTGANVDERAAEKEPRGAAHRDRKRAGGGQKGESEPPASKEQEAA